MLMRDWLNIIKPCLAEVLGLFFFLWQVGDRSVPSPGETGCGLFCSAGSSGQTQDQHSSEPTGDTFGCDVGPKSESLTGGELPESESTDELRALVRPPPPPPRPRGVR